MGRRRRMADVFALALLLWAGASVPLRAQGPEPPPPLERAYLLWRAGTLHHLLGQYDRAIELFRESIDIRPTAEAHTYLGWSLSHLGRIEEAIAECRKAIPLDPDYGNPYNDIGVYLIDLGRPDEAVPWLEKAMRAKRYCCYQFPHFNLGRVLLMKGQEAAAERAFERALTYDPGYLPARKALEYLRKHGGQAL
ncbi:MAG: tetratricopeptide repeat protein [Kiloniellaceae bacterium]